MTKTEIEQFFDNIQMVPEFIAKILQYGHTFIDENGLYYLQYETAPKDLDDDISNKKIWFDIEGEKELYAQLLVYKLDQLKLN
jgi:hypothetical protein